MLKIIAIDHIVLRTTKLNKMLFFYCQILGCTIERQTSSELGLTQLRAGSSLIDLVVVDSELGRIGGGPPSSGENNLDHFCLKLSVISTSELNAHLASFDLTFEDFSLRYGAEGFGESLYVKDPEGNVVELKSQGNSAKN